jgi:hypothetical protein
MANFRGIAFQLGDGTGSLVKGFSEANPLPPGGFQVSKVDIIEKGEFSFIALLNAIIKTKAKDLLLVVHGHIDGTGLYLPIASGAPDVTGRSLELLMQVASGKSLNDRQAAEFGVDQTVATQLLDLMKQVHAMNLDTVEWRACDLGKKPDVLKQFRDFFGANLMGAPVIANNFGIAVINIGPISNIPDKYWREFSHYYYPDKSNTKIYYFLKLDPRTGWPIEGGIFAENKDDVKDWIQKKINPQGQVPRGPLFMHHLWKEADANHALDPGTPILPLEDEYKSNILYVRGP